MPVGKLRRAAVVLAIGVIVLLAVALALTLYGEWRLARAMERFEATLGSTDLADLMLPEVPAAENAATWLQAGGAAVVVSEELHGLDRLDAWGEEPWDDEMTALARRYTDDNAPALELLWRAADCPGSTYGLDYRRGPETNLPPFGDLLRASRLLHLDARLAFAEGDLSRVRLDLATLDRLAGSLARETLLISAVVVLAVDRLYLSTVHRLVTGGFADPALLAEVEEALAARDRHATYLRALAADGSMVTRLPGDWLVESRSPRPLGWLRRQLMRPLDRLIIAGFLDDYRELGELAALPWPEAVARGEARAEKASAGSVAHMIYPNLIDSLGKLKAGQSVTQLAIEAIRYRRALVSQGAYPTGRPALVDPYTGGEVRVERRPDGDVVIEAPGALELWRASHSIQARRGDHQFRWPLPPPG